MRVHCTIFAREDVYYDLHVPGEEHYLAEGIWHHNTGKTRAILEKVYWLTQEYPGCRILLTRQTRESMSETVLVTFEEKVLGAGHAAIGEAGRRMRTAYQFENGAEVVVSGLDKPEKIMSGEYDVICIFEATETSESAFEMLTTRLRNHVIPWQQIICDCNPGAPTHWLNQRASTSKMVRLRSSHRDNPFLFNGSDWTEAGRTYLSKLDALTGHRRERLLNGRWVQSEGVIYEGWNPSVHVIPSFAIPMSWTKFRAIDFGYVNPFVVQWWAVDPDDRMYLYREVYKTGVTTPDMVPVIKRLSAPDRLSGTVCDHDAEDRAILSAAGISTRRARKDVQQGIQAVQGRLRVQRDGKPRLFVFADALVEPDQELRNRKLPCGTVEEIDGYVWQPATEGRAAKEEPLKLNDHGCDAMRYAVMYADRVRGEAFKIESPACEE